MIRYHKSIGLEGIEHDLTESPREQVRIMKRRMSFGNCVECRSYGYLNQEGRCKECVEYEQDLIETALDLVKENPEITAEELAITLEVEGRQVMEWLRKGLVRCVAIRFNCPRCGVVNQNRFSCSSCGYQPESTLPPANPTGSKGMMLWNSRRVHAIPTSLGKRMRRRKLAVG